MCSRKRVRVAGIHFSQRIPKLEYPPSTSARETAPPSVEAIPRSPYRPQDARSPVVLRLPSPVKRLPCTRRGALDRLARPSRVTEPNEFVHKPAEATSTASLGLRGEQGTALLHPRETRRVPLESGTLQDPLLRPRAARRRGAASRDLPPPRRDGARRPAALRGLPGLGLAGHGGVHRRGAPRLGAPRRHRPHAGGAPAAAAVVVRGALRARDALGGLPDPAVLARGMAPPSGIPLISDAEQLP